MENIDENQTELDKRLYHWGLTSIIVRDHIKHTGNNFNNAFLRLVLEKGIPINDLLMMIVGLNIDQVCGLSKGLSVDDVKEMNEHQIRALEECRTIKTNLSAKDLRDKKWFNSYEHVNALSNMLFHYGFTVQEAMQELDGLTREQANLAIGGIRRDDIVGLNEFHLKALDLKWYTDNRDTKCKDLTGSHLRGKNWFNSDTHVSALRYLIVRKKIDIAESITQLDGLSEKQL